MCPLKLCDITLSFLTPRPTATSGSGRASSLALFGRTTLKLPQKSTGCSWVSWSPAGGGGLDGGRGPNRTRGHLWKTKRSKQRPGTINGDEEPGRLCLTGMSHGGIEEDLLDLYGRRHHQVPPKRKFKTLGVPSLEDLWKTSADLYHPWSSPSPPPDQTS